MAESWKDLETYAYKDNYKSFLTGHVSIIIQYDENSVSPTSAKIRFKMTKSISDWLEDMVYILTYPTDVSKRALYKIKTDRNHNSDKWPYYSDPFTISKEYTASTFSLPTFWVCNDGADNTDPDTPTAFYNNYNDNAWRGKNLRSTHSAKSIAIASSNTVAEALDSDNIGSPVVINEGGNRFSVSYSKGAGGTNNPIKNYSIYWSYADDDYTCLVSKRSNASYESELISFDPNKTTKDTTKVTATIKVRLTAYPTYPEDTSAYAIIKDITVEVPYCTDVVPKMPTITDNGNNKFTITASVSNGANNPVLSNTIYYKIGSDGWKSESGFKVTKSITASASTASQQVSAYVVSKGANFNSSSAGVSSGAATLSITNYQSPGIPGTPIISYSKSKLTLRENWTLVWGDASPTNTASLVKGYRIRVYVNGQSIPIKSTTGKILTVDTGISNGAERYPYNRESTETTLVFDPVLNNINIGDEVSIGILAYTRNGNGTMLLSEKVTSSTYVVQNAGIAHVKARGEWHEGQVWIKAAGEWHEAEAVYIKAGGVWEESK